MVSKPIFLSTVKKKAAAIMEPSNQGTHQLVLCRMSSNVLLGAKNAFTMRCGSESLAGATSLGIGGTAVLMKCGPFLKKQILGDKRIVAFGTKDVSQFLEKCSQPAG